MSFELLAEPQIAAACLRNSARGFQKRGYSLRSCVHQVGAGPDEGQGSDGFILQIENWRTYGGKPGHHR